jgi:hypothetical protein
MCNAPFLEYFLHVKCNICIMLQRGVHPLLLEKNAWSVVGKISCVWSSHVGFWLYLWIFVVFLEDAVIFLDTKKNFHENKCTVLCFLRKHTIRMFKKNHGFMECSFFFVFGNKFLFFILEIFSFFLKNVYFLLKLIISIVSRIWRSPHLCRLCIRKQRLW